MDRNYEDDFMKRSHKILSDEDSLMLNAILGGGSLSSGSDLQQEIARLNKNVSVSPDQL